MSRRLFVLVLTTVAAYCVLFKVNGTSPANSDSDDVDTLFFTAISNGNLATQVSNARTGRNRKQITRAQAVPLPPGKDSSTTQNRRKFLASLGVLTLLSPSLSVGDAAAEVAQGVVEQEEVGTTSSLVEVYFGVGCFWHVQHEFVEAEKKILGRTNSEVTSLTGYAGGVTQERSQGEVCYHNMFGIGDYGKLGHGEVVKLEIPAVAYGQFADEYFKLFTQNGDRPDFMDRGGEYRHLVGLPRGIESPLYPELKRAAQEKSMKLVAGVGSDGDNLGKRMVYVYDSDIFPFYQGEVYHQFHDGFAPGENYPQSYNNIAKEKVAAGELKGTGCPDINLSNIITE